MSSMFNNCRNLKNVDLNKFDTSNVTDMSYMFSFCESLANLDVSKLNTANVTNMNNMFINCSSLITIYSDDNSFVTSAVTSGSYMFAGCNNLVGGNGTAYSAGNTSYGYAHVDAEGNPGYFTAK